MLALIGQPEIAVLDELTTGLDPEARRETWSLIEGVRDRGVTIVLVTHYMEEAERLCDRVAVIDHGMVTALDHPAALGARSETRQADSTHAPDGLPDGLLWALPEVSGVEHHGQELVVVGSGDLLTAVMLAFDRAGMHANEVRPETANLEDAFLAIIDEPTQPRPNRRRSDEQPGPRTHPPTAGGRSDCSSQRDQARAQPPGRGDRRPRHSGLAAGGLRQHPVDDSRERGIRRHLVLHPVCPNADGVRAHRRGSAGAFPRRWRPTGSRAFCAGCRRRRYRLPGCWRLRRPST